YDVNTGTIIANCNVPDDLGTIFGLGATYTDSDGTSTGASVTIELKRTAKTGGITVIHSFSSNSYSDTGLTYKSQAINGGSGHTMNNTDYMYYIAISLNRNSSSLTGSIRGVELQ